MVDATGWIARFLKEISNSLSRLSERDGTSEGQHSEVPPIGHRCCNGINDAENSSLYCLNRLCLIIRQTMVPNNRIVFKYWSDDGDI